MKKYYVNRINETENAIQGIINDDELVFKNVKLAHGEQKAVELIARTQKYDGFFLIKRFDKYAGYIKYKKGEGFIMSLFDFKNSDSSIEEYSKLENWTYEQKNEFIKLAHEILDSDSELCELVLVSNKHL